MRNLRLFARLKQTSAALSTPLMALATGVLPLIGMIDAARAGRELEQALNTMVLASPTRC